MSELARDEHWQRLDPRMLLVHPLRELVRFLPVIIAILLAGSSASGLSWELLGIGVPIALGVLRYLTTRFRITGDRIELKRGLVNRHVLSTRVERVRTIDLTASLVQRALGLTTVRVGTGTSSSNDDSIDLDGLPVDRAARLREALLRLTAVNVGAEAGAPVPSVAPDRVVLRLDLAWLRFAPLTSGGLVVAVGVLGVGFQAVNLVGGIDVRDPVVIVQGVDRLGAVLAVALGLLLLAVAISLLAVGGYLLTNWGFTLTHAASGRSRAWHLRRGLLTTRETTLDDERVAGVTVGEPLAMRLAGGGRLSAIVTGLGSEQSGSSVLVPPAPREVVEGVARQVLRAAGPVDAPLVRHGAAADRRRLSRGLWPTLLLAVVLVVLVVVADWPAWLLVVAVLAPVVGLGLALDRIGSLGHTLVEGYVVTRSGSVTRQRSALAVEDVIGWNFHASWFQRRAGLVSLVATTAGGRQSITILDVPEEEAVSLAGRAMPDLIAPFAPDLPPDRSPV